MKKFTAANPTVGEDGEKVDRREEIAGLPKGGEPTN